MADEVDESVGKKLVSELTVDQLFTIALDVFQDFERRRDAKGVTKLMSMTVEQFTDLTMNVLKMKSMRSATTEADVTRRILADWQGLMEVEAVAQPFRLKTAADIDQLVNNLRTSINDGSELVVAVAVSPAPDLYKAY